jgi:hypothetical protein
MSDFIKEVNRFYPTYLQAHRHPLNKILHLVGNLFIVSMALGIIVTAVLTQRWYGLLILPFLLTCGIYVFAWPAHRLIEKNKPATWNVSRWVTKACDWKMMYDLVFGRLKLDTRVRMSPQNIENAVKAGNPFMKNIGYIKGVDKDD